MNRTIDSAWLRQMYICLALWFSFASAAVCQDPNDPFGSPDGTMDTTNAFDSTDAAAATATPAANAVPSSDSDTDPLVRRVRDNPPTTVPEMAKAITWMVQMRSWETVGSLLDRVAAQNWPLSSKAQLAREISPAVWSQLFRSTGKLTEAQSKSLTSLYSAPTAYARDPQIIDSLIDQLASPSAAQRQLAQLKLQDGQRASLKRLLDRLLDGDTKVPAKILAETVVLFDREGVDALRAACNLQDAARSSRVVLSLADISSNEFSSELAAALFSGRYPTEVKQSLAEKIQTRYTRIPSQAVTTDYLTKKYLAALDDYQTQRTNSGSLTNTIWQPTADGKITSRDVTPDIAALERLCQVACLLSQLEVVEPAVDALTTVMQLQRAYQLNPTLVDAEFASQLIQPLPVDRSAEAVFWVDVFRQASSRQMHGAAIRSLQLLQAHVQAGKPGAPLDFLSELLSDGRPVVRYLALEIIATADPQANYAASERALAIALEMTQLSQGPQALIIGANNELCMAAEQMIQLHTGSRSVVANSARGAFQELTKQNPIEFMVVVDRVHDMSLFEMLQRLRNSGSLPIAVLVERLYQHEQDFIQKGAGFYTSTLSRDPDQMKLVIDQLTRTLDVRPLTSDDRIRFSSLAANFLTKISADRNTYAFYPVTEWHQQMVSLPGIVRPQAQSQLLSGLGSKESQRKLASLASTSGLSEQDRFAAARSFETSVRQFGMLLSDQEIKSTYEWYNRLGPNDPAIAKAMGYILDIIEAQTGSRLWPDPL